jgi:hypothetical protein
MVSDRYVSLMNERYERLAAKAQETDPAAVLALYFEPGSRWQAAISVAPPGHRSRWRKGEGQTQEDALTELETVLDLPRWVG